MNKARQRAHSIQASERIYKIRACFIALMVLVFGIACDWEWAWDIDEDDANSEEVVTEDIGTLTVGITDSEGEATVEDLESDATITFQVEDESGNPIPETTIRFMSDGEDFNAMVYNSSGEYLPALYFGTPDEDSWQTVTLIGVAEETITYDAPASEGHFDLEDMFDDTAVRLRFLKHELTI